MLEHKANHLISYSYTEDQEYMDFNIHDLQDVSIQTINVCML